MKTLDPQRARRASLSQVEAFGMIVPEGLPLLDADMRSRALEEATDRCLGLQVVTACAFGFDKAGAREWIARENVGAALAQSERDFLNGGEQSATLKRGVEALWALAWSIGAVPAIDFGAICAGDFVKQFPNLRIGESSATFRAKLRLRELEVLFAHADLAYCLHVAAVQAALASRRAPMQTYVYAERRRALDWMLSDERWENISLDT